VFGERAVLGDCVGDAARAVVAKDRPDLQRAERTRKLDAVVPEGESLFGLPLEDFDVALLGSGERGARALRLAEDEAAAVERRLEPLGLGERDGVGLFESS